MKIRTFIATPIDDSLKNHILRTQAAFERQGVRARWTKPENTHLTLFFLGDTEEETTPLIASQLDRIAANNHAFKLEAKGMGFFGSPSSPRVLWIGLCGEINRIISIQRQTVSAIRQAGLAPDDETFKPHLTIGRIKQHGEARKIHKLLSAKKETCFGTIFVQDLLFIKSVLTSTGPIHSIIHQSKLSV